LASNSRVVGLVWRAHVARDSLHGLRRLLHLGVQILLEHVVLAVVDLVKQEGVVDAKHLVLEQGSVCLFVLLLTLLRIIGLVLLLLRVRFVPHFAVGLFFDGRSGGLAE